MSESRDMLCSEVGVGKVIEFRDERSFQEKTYADWVGRKTGGE